MNKPTVGTQLQDLQLEIVNVGDLTTERYGPRYCVVAYDAAQDRTYVWFTARTSVTPGERWTVSGMVKRIAWYSNIEQFELTRVSMTRLVPVL